MHLIFGFLALLILVTCVFAFNVLQILSLLTYPFSRAFFRGINEKLSAVWWSLNYQIAVGILGKRYTFAGDQNFRAGENAFLIANHQSMTDVLAIMALADQHERGAHAKFFAKEALKHVPGIGWGMRFLHYILLKRNWTEDADSILSTFETIRRENIKFWLVSFPEGTRSNDKKITASKRYARERNLPVLEHVMIPRTKGAVATVKGLGDSLEAIYDLTILYEGKPPSLGKYLFFPTKPIHIHAERFSRTQIPESQESLVLWFQERFRAKDARIAQFLASKTN